MTSVDFGERLERCIDLGISKFKFEGCVKRIDGEFVLRYIWKFKHGKFIHESEWEGHIEIDDALDSMLERMETAVNK